ncbi:MAG: transposase [Verrucomicrobiae bacterium]|nr:transposase [Verrucomicrobiae bacterium]
MHKSGSPIVALFHRVELGKSPWKNPAKKNQKTPCRITSESRLGATLVMLGVLHTWSRTLIHHPHVHYLVAGVA